MVVGKVWRNREGQVGFGYAKRWTIKLHWHTKCWIKQAIDALKKRPVIETRGRVKLEISKEQSAARVKILRRHAAVVQRIRIEMSKGEKQNIDRIIRLGSSINKLKEEIEPFGGVPKNWK